jgi:hypothetical protein
MPPSRKPETELWISDDAWIEAELPKRPWLAKRYALRGAVTLLVGPPSACKSSLTLAWACAVALARAYGDFRPTEAGPVVVYNVEDDEDEQRLRLSAILRQFDATPPDICGKIVRVGPSGFGTLFVVDRSTGKVSPTTAMDRLRQLVKERRPKMLIADPFVELHTAEENNNTAMRAVVAEFRTLAREFDMAVVIVLHTGKGALTPGDLDAARGASAQIGAARIVLTLLPMSEGDTGLLGIENNRTSRSRYVRLDDARQNYAGIEDAQWFVKTLYTLDNGEVVAAAEPWDPQHSCQSIPLEAANRILDEIATGLDGGKRRYTDAAAAGDRAVWRVVQRHLPGMTPKEARDVIANWKNAGVLRTGEYLDPTDRKKRSGIYVINENRPS